MNGQSNYVIHKLPKQYFIMRILWLIGLIFYNMHIKYIATRVECTILQYYTKLNIFVNSKNQKINKLGQKTD